MNTMETEQSGRCPFTSTACTARDDGLGCPWWDGRCTALDDLDGESPREFYTRMLVEASR